MPAARAKTAAAPEDGGRATHLIWLDLEMTGLKPVQDRILEVAMVITTEQLEVIAESPVWVVHQPDEILSGMDKWNQSTHGKSGLIDKVKNSILTVEQVEAEALAFLHTHSKRGASPMCGNSICQDRRFLAQYMPQLEDYFHYRNLDVSTLKVLCKRWLPTVAKGFEKHNKHQALADIYESIEELRYYRQHFLVAQATPASGNP